MQMDQRIIDLYDEFTHGGMNRRQFLDRLQAMTGSAAAAAALVPLLQSNYALAQTVPETDARLVTENVAFPNGSGQIAGYLAKPAKAAGKLPGVLVIHENRGLNPHIKDVTRRLALEGFVAFGVDFLSPLGGTPDTDDKARDMFAQLKANEVIASGKAARAGLAARPDVDGRVGAVGFCWGGGVVNNLAVADPDLAAGVAYYGRQPKAEDVVKIKAPLLLHYAGLDQNVNAGIPAYEAALKAAGKTFEVHVYEGAQHGFNNDTGAARYNKAAADLAWQRTVAWLKRYDA
jgi:carboxymethylenebutenolidase